MRGLKKPGPEFTLLLSKSLTQLVQAEIERQILSGELEAGERLNEVAIAEHLNVSRGPVREALRTLEEAGLVRFEKNRGAAVRVITPDEAAEIYEIRGNLEALACRRLAARITSGEVAELHGRVEDMEAAVGGADVAAFHRLNIGFHERLIELSGNGELGVVYRRLVGNLTLFRQRTLAREGALGESNAEHRRIVERLAAHDASGAGVLMAHHIESSSQRTRLALRGLAAAAPEAG